MSNRRVLVVVSMAVAFTAAGCCPNIKTPEGVRCNCDNTETAVLAILDNADAAWPSIKALLPVERQDAAQAAFDDAMTTAKAANQTFLDVCAAVEKGEQGDIKAAILAVYSAATHILTIVDIWSDRAIQQPPPPPAEVSTRVAKIKLEIEQLKQDADRFAQPAPAPAPSQP